MRHRFDSLRGLLFRIFDKVGNREPWEGGRRGGGKEENARERFRGEILSENRGIFPFNRISKSLRRMPVHPHEFRELYMDARPSRIPLSISILEVNTRGKKIGALIPASG